MMGTRDALLARIVELIELRGRRFMVTGSHEKVARELAELRQRLHRHWPIEEPTDETSAAGL